MKKLKSKVFFTISTILTIFVFAVFLISNARTYSEKKENVKNVLDKMIELSDNTNSNNVFMDFTVYNIILDENGMYKETVSHTYEDVIDIVKIKNIANKIIKYHHSKYYIGNLYNAKYSYAFTDNNSLILMDNSEVKNTLTKTLITTSIIFIFLESCVILTSFILTSWITEPVSESFDKQKRFIADASHELKTPLTVINASVEAYYNDKNEKWIHNIKEETEIIEHFLEIEKVRFPDTISYECTLPDGIGEYKILKLVLQPIVENCIKHGFEGKEELGIISITARSSGEYIEIDVTDNGCGFDVPEDFPFRKPANTRGRRLRPL